MRFLVTGGGTGGHVYPALAIARGLREAVSGAEILYVGTKKGLEARVVPQAGFNFTTITVEGFERRLFWRNIPRLGRLAVGLAQALAILRRFRPGVVVGTGGYVCGPVCLAAAFLKIPLVLHEQNAHPGLTNRVLAQFARTVCLTFAEATHRLPRRPEIVVTGLPVRSEILQTSADEGRRFFNFRPDQTVLLATGGSQGAKSLNEAMLPVIREVARRPDIALIHLTGQNGYEAVRHEVEKAGIRLDANGNIRLLPYLYEMEYALAASDLVIGRAGASFLAEITARGLPAILIPYPYAAANHQEHNARFLARKGAAMVIPDRELRGHRLWEAVQRLLEDRQKLAAMAVASAALGKPRALEEIIKVILAAGRF
ncbi:MAG: UDP-N-acetylglucosamine--N-acetylmuramyl-(pentapeptide) pyrophosphoryl-undecaprenol [Clostridia bacterium]|nr:UDP-N-acetylglucosamine--N-acetylmuramyl-(pentapeptide) pyrophosphoryl-undecaprenol [Clostridia bacterium]